MQLTASLFAAVMKRRSKFEKLVEAICTILPEIQYLLPWSGVGIIKKLQGQHI